MSAERAWWQDGVIYQIYPRSFADSDGDGVGDLQGILNHLDHLRGTPDALDVDAIWLSPVYPSPGHDFGYDVSDYEDIDPLFGTLADFDRLTEAAHGRGLRMIMDLVMNHSSHRHPWFADARSGRESAKRDWYIWRDSGPDGAPPNNWQSIFGGGAWERDAASAQFYYHMFLRQQPDLNWRNPDLRARMFQMVRFWLDRGVDGFRLDVVNAYFKDAQFRDNPPALGLRAFDRQKHLYDRDRPEMLDVLQELRRTLDGYPERMAVGEIMGANPELIARYSGPSGLHLAFNFDLTRQPWRPRAIQRAVMRTEAGLPAEVWPCYTLSNHDVDRHATRYGGGPAADDRAKVAAALLLTLRGTPFMYYGEEIGMQNTPVPRAEIQDPPGRRYWPFYAGRDPERTPMQWTGGPGAGFTSGMPWLRLNRDYTRRNVAAQRADPNSVLSFYRQMLRLRRESPALRRGSFTPLLERPVNVLAYLRQASEQTVLVALNFFSWPATVQLDAPLPSSRWRLRLSTFPGEHTGLSGDALHLAPMEACVLEAE